jgi:ligand-binding SRPBCC domain-containing protein
MSSTPFLLERTQTVPSDLESVFAFFKDPRNLAEITPPWLRFRVVWASDPLVRRGTRIRYRIAWFGLPLRWESAIAQYDENLRFADEMIVGPYASWYHVHEFRPTTGGVEVSDRVEYRLPLGILGRLAHSVLVRRQLSGIFDYRAKRVAKIFGASS